MCLGCCPDLNPKFQQEATPTIDSGGFFVCVILYKIAPRNKEVKYVSRHSVSASVSFGNLVSLEEVMIEYCCECHREVHWADRNRVEYGVRSVFHSRCLLTYLRRVNAHKKDPNTDIVSTSLVHRLFFRWSR